MSEVPLYWAGAGRGHVLFGGISADAQRWSRGNFRHDHHRGIALISYKARNQILERKQLSPLQLHSPHVRFIGPASGRGTSNR